MQFIKLECNFKSENKSNNIIIKYLLKDLNIKNLNS